MTKSYWVCSQCGEVMEEEDVEFHWYLYPDSNGEPIRKQCGPIYNNKEYTND